MSKVLSQDPDLTLSIANEVLDGLRLEGYTNEEIIPGLVAAIGLASVETIDPGQALDEASDLLSGVNV